VLGAARQQLGGMDALILNHIMNSGEAYDSRGWLGAGGGDWQRQLAIVRQTFDVNTFSFMSLATAALPELEATGGAIVVVSSMAGKMGLPAVAAYSSSKHALHGFFDSLRHDLVNSRSNVSITTAILGSIDTESAKKGTTLPDGSPALPNVAWSPADECAAAIARGGGTPSPLRPFPPSARRPIHATASQLLCSDLHLAHCLPAALRTREVYFPPVEILSSLLIRPFAPSLLDSAVRLVMSSKPLALQLREALLPHDQQ